MRILYLSYDGLTDPLGQSQILPYLKGLVTLGYSFTIISFEKGERNDQISIIREALDDIGIEWVPLNYHKDPPVFSTLYDLRKLRKTARRVLKTHDFDAVHCRSYITSIVGQELKLQYGLSFIFDMRGYWADERVEGNIWDLKNPIFKTIYLYFKKKEREFLKNADVVVALTERSKKFLQENFGNENISVIPCCVDIQHFVPLESKPSEGPYIGYLGSLGTWYLMDEMIDFFKVFLKTSPEYKWLIITHDDKDQLLERVRKKSLPVDKVRIEKSHYRDVPAWISKMDAMLIFIKPAFSKTASSPTKMGESMAMNIPVVANSGVGDVEEIIRSSGGGVLVHEFTEESYNQTTNELIRLLNEGKNSPREWVKTHLSLDYGIKQYKKVYENLRSD